MTAHTTTTTSVTRVRHDYMYQNTLLYIDGTWSPAASGRTLLVVNPATGEQIGTVARAERSDLDRALEAADKGFKVWRRISAFERSKIMRKAANLMRERADAIAPLLTQEQGKTLAHAKAEIMAGADTIDWFAEEARRAYGRVIPARTEAVQAPESGSSTPLRDWRYAARLRIAIHAAAASNSASAPVIHSDSVGIRAAGSCGTTSVRKPRISPPGNSVVWMFR
jgi:delta 1-pyrroline-5-carboxylate dehydrogenase